MTRDELIEKVAISMCGGEAWLDTVHPFGRRQAMEKASAAIDTIFAALKEPSKEMIIASWNDAKSDHNTHIWQAMLAASPLAPEGGRE